MGVTSATWNKWCVERVCQYNCPKYCVATAVQATTISIVVAVLVVIAIGLVICICLARRFRKPQARQPVQPWVAPEQAQPVVIIRTQPAVSAPPSGGAAAVVPYIIAEKPKSATERLAELKKLMDDGLINEEEYAGLKAKVLESM